MTDQYERSAADKARMRVSIPPRPSGGLTMLQICMVMATLVGSIAGVAVVGMSWKTQQQSACEKAEKAADAERARYSDMEYAFRKEQERKEQEMVLRHQQAVQECEKEGNIPLMGIDLTVVCVARVHVEWTHSLKDPAPWL